MGEGNKTEKPTPQRQKKAREKGQVARSRELSNTLAFLGGLAVFFWQGSGAIQQWRHLMRSTLDLAAEREIIPANAFVFWTGTALLRWTVPAMLTALALSVLSSVMQGGVIFASEAIKPDLNKMNPGQKLGQMFSITGLSGVLKSLLPFGAMAYLAYGTLSENAPSIVQASQLGLRSLVSLILSLAFEIGWKSGLVLLIWAAVDYLLVWRKHNNDLMMTREELRQEYKENEGDPYIKGRIRKLQQQMRRKEMLKETETATVVVTNPTHFAVALRYDMHMDAPVLVAKGRDRLAEEIKGVARWNAIPIIENPPLARALYQRVEMGQSIPSKLYTAVAEILAMVYRAQAQVRQQGQPQR